MLNFRSVSQKATGPDAGMLGAWVGMLLGEASSGPSASVRAMIWVCGVLRVKLNGGCCFGDLSSALLAWPYLPLKGEKRL